MSLIAADYLVRRELQKSATAADIGRGIIGAARGAGRVVQKGFSSAGRQAAEEIGGTGGRLVGGAIKAAPTLAVGGAAAYGINEAAGDPVGRHIAMQRARLGQRIQGSQAYQQGGVYY